jgi:hypothetical protein
VPLPETIAIRYTEEEAGYVSVRPVVKQTFRLRDLADMVVSVTGKDPARVQQILRSGTLVYHSFRYWWPGFDATPDELVSLLAQFPDDDPSRTFRVEDCTAALVDGSGGPGPPALELTREQAGRKRLFHSRSLWDSLMGVAEGGPLRYEGYCYARRADLYRRVLSQHELAALLDEALQVAPRSLRTSLRPLLHATSLVYACPRKMSSGVESSA